MNTNQPSVKQIAYNYGVLLGLVSVVSLVLLYLMNTYKNVYINILGYAFVIYFIFAAIKTYRTQNDGFLKLGDAFKVGLATAAIAGIVSATYAYIHYTFIHPGYIDLVLNETREALIASGQQMSEQEMEQVLKFTEMFTSPFAIATISLIGSLFFGFIISLVSGLILKRENPDEQE